MEIHLCIFFLFSFCFIVSSQNSCLIYHSNNGLTYNLSNMMRDLNENDYLFYNSYNSSLSSYYINICANTKEYCNPFSPVCKQETIISPPQNIFTSYGDINNYSWNTFNTNQSEGITLTYSSNVQCTTNNNITTQSFINIECDVSINTGIIDSIEESNNSCSLTINMRSKYGCGYNNSIPLTCSNTYIKEESVCLLENNEYSCDNNNFIISLSLIDNYPLYSYYINSNLPETYYTDNEPYGGLYEFKFTSLYEVSNNDKISSDIIDFSLLSWDFINPIVNQYDDNDCTQETEFTIINNNNIAYWDSLSISNYLLMENNNNNNKDINNIQISFNINNYIWQNSSSTHLVLTFNYQQKDGTVNTFINSTATSVRNSYFTISPFSIISNSTSAITSIISDTQIEISRFTGSLLMISELEMNLPLLQLPQPPCNVLTCTFSNLDISASIDPAPHVTFNLPGNSNEYTIILYSISEITSNSDSIDIVTSSSEYFINFTWNVTNPQSIQDDNENIYVTYTFYSGKYDRWSSISLQVTIKQESSISHFILDLIINNYIWVSDDISSNLRIEYDISGPGAISYSLSTVLVGNTYIQSPIYSTVKSYNTNQIITNTLYYSDSPYIIIPYFTGTLENTIKVGINTTNDFIIIPESMISVQGEATIQILDTLDYWIWLLISLGILIIVAIGIILLIFITKKYHQ